MSSLSNLSQFSEAIVRFDQSSWRYDPISGRYRGANGRFLSAKAVEALVDGRINKLGAELRRFTRMLADGSITLDQWQGSVREALKLVHVQAAIIGNGGRETMGASDWGRIGQRLPVWNILTYRILLMTFWAVAFLLPSLLLASAYMLKVYAAVFGKELVFDKKNKDTP
jgi:hypothetical protein